MSHKLNSEIAVIGIDIGKNWFHVVGHDRRGAMMLRQQSALWPASALCQQRSFDHIRQRWQTSATLEAERLGSR